MLFPSGFEAVKIELSQSQPDDFTGGSQPEFGLGGGDLIDQRNRQIKGEG